MFAILVKSPPGLPVVCCLARVKGMRLHGFDNYRAGLGSPLLPGRLRVDANVEDQDQDEAGKRHQGFPRTRFCNHPHVECLTPSPRQEAVAGRSPYLRGW